MDVGASCCWLKTAPRSHSAAAPGTMVGKWCEGGARLRHGGAPSCSFSFSVSKASSLFLSFSPLNLNLFFLRALLSIPLSVRVPSF